MFRLPQSLFAAKVAAGISESNLVNTPKPSTKEPWQNLQGLLVSARPARPTTAAEDRPSVIGELIEKVSERAYKVRLKPFHPPPMPTKFAGIPQSASLTLPAGSIVRVFYGSSVEDGMSMEGLILKVNGNGTYVMLMENNEIELSVSNESVYKHEGGSKVVTNPKFLELEEWIRSSVADKRDVVAVSLILFKRGWRVEQVYLLEKSDVSGMLFLSKIERELIMEKAKWERDHHGVVRLVRRERVKDRDIRYALAKYKGTLSCIVGICVVSYVFTSNFRAYRKQQRPYQLKLAAKNLTKMHQALASDEYRDIKRDAEEEDIRSALHQLDKSRPRALVITGFSGCGKSTACRRAVQEGNIPSLFVDLRSSEDTLHSVVRSMGIANIGVCGDLLDFTAEVLKKVTTKDHLPILVVKLREGNDLEKVYKETISLVSDHRACHMIFEVPLESLTSSHLTLSRLDFLVSPIFSRSQAFAYTRHLIDPLDLTYFLDTVGTNTSDLDELYGAVRHRGVDAVAYTSLKLMKSIRRVHTVCNKNPDLQAALFRLAERPFESGLSEQYAEELSRLHRPLAKELVLYDPVEDRWLFACKVLHTATRCYMPPPTFDNYE